MKIGKKLIISNTILFLAIMIYIVIFKSIFGDSNILVAVMSITGMLMYMGRDLTGELPKYLIKFIIFYLIIGIGSFLASSNMWLAIPINFIIVFLLSYSFGHVLKNAMYLPFTLLYLFLLAEPVPMHAMPLRLGALIVGAIFIVLPQIIINKNKVGKSGKKIIGGILEGLTVKIKLLEENKKTKDLDVKINSMIQSLKNIIYDKKEKGFYISEEGRGYLDILASLERINYLLSSGTLDEELLKDISEGFDIFKKYIKNEEVKKEEYIEELKLKHKDCTSISNIQAIGSLMFLSNSIEKLNKKSFDKEVLIKNIKEDAYGLRKIKFNSVRITYALRIAIEVVIACFIMDYFHLQQGRWIMYTVLSLTNPIFEITKSKTKDRIIATIIGAVFIAAVFSVIKDTTVRMLVVMAAGYANVYCVTYRQKIISVTVSAIGAAIVANSAYVGASAVANSPIVIAMQRIGFILIGAIIALIINRFLFRYDVKKVNKNLENISKDIINDLVGNLDKITEEGRLNHYINTVYILISQLNETIKSNFTLVKEKELNHEEREFLRNKLALTSTIYELNKFIQNLKLSDEKKEKIKNSLENLNINKKESIGNNDAIQLMRLESMDEKIVVSSLIEIKRNYNSIKKEF